MFDNGLNCGRYVQVTVGDYCTGTNDGAQNEPFCRNGSWISRPVQRRHARLRGRRQLRRLQRLVPGRPLPRRPGPGLAQQFVLNGPPVGDMYPTHWNNRQVSWKFVPAPELHRRHQHRSIQGAQAYWSAIAISHLPNGIHGVDYYSAGGWQSAPDEQRHGRRLHHRADHRVAGGHPVPDPGRRRLGQLGQQRRVYSFSLPACCTPGARPRTRRPLHHLDGIPRPSPTPTPSPTARPRRPPPRRRLPAAP